MVFIEIPFPYKTNRSSITGDTALHKPRTERRRPRGYKYKEALHTRKKKEKREIEDDNMTADTLTASSLTRLQSFFIKKRSLIKAITREKKDCAKQVDCNNPLKNSCGLEAANFGKLPTELLVIIFQLLSPFDLSHSVSRVNKRFCEIAFSDQLWKCLFNDRWIDRDAKLRKELTWRHAYRTKYKTEMNWKHGNCVQKLLNGHNAGVWCLKMHQNVMVCTRAGN